MNESDAASPLVGIVVVSHSRQLAEGVVELARQMAGDDVLIRAAGGAGDGGLGTDADAIARAISAADCGAGVVILADLGSAILASRTAIEALGPDVRGPVVISNAPLVEGAVIAAVQASIGQGLEEVAAAAEEARSMDKGAGA
jgi:dihydroxyacetone kinase phosphotransfer subunit